MNYHAALASFPKITYQRYKKLKQYFGNMEEVWRAELGELVASGLEEHIGDEFIGWREKNPVEKITEGLLQENIQTVSLGETNYPRLLSEIADPPHTLFFRGKLPLDEQPAVALVGTRKCSTYGRQMAAEFAGALAAQGVVIVSGLALGIDGAAHQAALQASGITVAVLGSGVDEKNIYPASHSGLARLITEKNGAVVSEYPPGFEPTSYSFPARNRIIAGLSLGTLVVEAPAESGALITAKCALDYNREVFAIPHALTATAGAGGNNLLKMGAMIVTEPNDILEALQLKNIKEIITNNQTLPSNPTEAKLLPHLAREPRHIDALIKLSGLDSATVNSALVMMEMKGKVKNMGGMLYVLR